MRRRDKNVRQLKFPLAEPVVRELRAGEPVELSGAILTARLSGHRYLLDQEPPLLRELLHNGAIYHCGPVVRKMKRKEEWKIVAAGPSASIHLEEYTAGAIIFLFWIPYFAEFIRWISPVSDAEGIQKLAAETPRQIANAHTFFNVCVGFFFFSFPFFLV